MAACARCESSRNAPAPVVAPFGAARLTNLLNPFSGHLPPSPPTAIQWPRVTTLWNVAPRLRVTKRIFDGRGSVTCTLSEGGTAQLDAAVREPLFRGEVQLDGGTSKLTWCKLWLFPGLSDAATRVELRSALDLRSGKCHAEVNLGLRGARREATKNSLRIVHRQPVHGGGVVNVDAGALLTLPDELRLATDGTGGLRALATKARMEVEVDQLDVCIEIP